MSKPQELARLAWRSRRGLLELDLLLTRFVRDELATLKASEQRRYEELLECSDSELMAILQGRAEPPAGMAELILRIQRTDTIYHDE